MTDTAVIKPNGKAPSVPSKSIGVSGVVLQGGVLVSTDYDRAWKGTERDKTISAMLNDPLIGAVLGGVEFLVRRVDWTVKAANDSLAAEDAKTFIQESLDDMVGHWPGDTLATVLTYLGWGWSCLEIVFKQRNGPTGNPTSRFSDGKTGWHRWALRPQATRYGWEFDGDDPTVLIQQDPASFRRIPIPLEKCLLFRYASRDNSPEGSTPLRVAYDAWYNKRKLQRIEAIGIERDLAGLPVGRVPSRDIAGNTDVYQAMQEIVTNIRNDAQGGLVIASERDEHGNLYQDISLMATGGAKSIATDPIIKRYANEVVTVFLANIMRAGQDGVGTLALGQEQSSLFQQAIGAHLDTIAQTINEQAVLPLCRLNGIPDGLVPTLEHGDIESADLGRLGKYLTDLATAGLLVDTPELRSFLHEVAGIPVPTAAEITAQQAKEAEEAAAAEKARVEALQAAQNAQGGQEGDQPTPIGKKGATGGKGAQEGRAVAASEIREMVEANGQLSLSDMMEVMAWWDRTVPEYAGMLNAAIVGEDEK